jgi:SAM-dependent methyltransferase
LDDQRLPWFQRLSVSIGCFLAPRSQPRTSSSAQKYDATAAAGYECGFARISSHFIPVLLGAAGVSVGHKVLDVATGTGLAAEAALALVGPTGCVTATDISPQMAERARERLNKFDAQLFRERVCLSRLTAISFRHCVSPGTSLICAGVATQTTPALIMSGTGFCRLIKSRFFGLSAFRALRLSRSERSTAR